MELERGASRRRQSQGKKMQLRRGNMLGMILGLQPLFYMQGGLFSFLLGRRILAEDDDAASDHPTTCVA
jgi:hypothetical protein